MKKLIFLTIFTLAIGAVAMAQDTEATPKKIQKQERTHVRENDQVHKQDMTKINERKQERIHARNEAALNGSARNQNMGARGNSMQRNSNMRMQKGAGAERK